MWTVLDLAKEAKMEALPLAGALAAHRRKVWLTAEIGCYPLWVEENGWSDNVDPAELPLRPETVAALERWQNEYEGWSDIYDPRWDPHAAPEDPALFGFQLSAWEQEGWRLWRRCREELGA